MVYEQPLADELRRQTEQVLLERLVGCVEFLTQPLEDDVELSMPLDEKPHAGAHLIQAEVRARGEIQHDGFAVQLADHDVIMRAKRRVESNPWHTPRILQPC